ncbi:hypothetical protein MMC20_004430 [Loxospora ochrophaea]|nr:hypothetical protein [Loxospora ochrophaea]
MVSQSSPTERSAGDRDPRHCDIYRSNSEDAKNDSGVVPTGGDDGDDDDPRKPPSFMRFGYCESVSSRSSASGEKKRKQIREGKKAVTGSRDGGGDNDADDEKGSPNVSDTEKPTSPPPPGDYSMFAPPGQREESPPRNQISGEIIDWIPPPPLRHQVETIASDAEGHPELDTIDKALTPPLQPVSSNELYAFSSSIESAPEVLRKIEADMKDNNPDLRSIGAMFDGPRNFNPTRRPRSLRISAEPHVEPQSNPRIVFPETQRHPSRPKPPLVARNFTKLKREVSKGKLHPSVLENWQPLGGISVESLRSSERVSSTTSEDPEPSKSETGNNSSSGTDSESQRVRDFPKEVPAFVITGEGEAQPKWKRKTLPKEKRIERVVLMLRTRAGHLKAIFPVSTSKYVNQNDDRDAGQSNSQNAQRSNVRSINQNDGLNLDQINDQNTDQSNVQNADRNDVQSIDQNDGPNLDQSEDQNTGQKDGRNESAQTKAQSENEAKDEDKQEPRSFDETNRLVLRQFQRDVLFDLANGCRPDTIEQIDDTDSFYINRRNSRLSEFDLTIEVPFSGETQEVPQVEFPGVSDAQESSIHRDPGTETSIAGWLRNMGAGSAAGPSNDPYRGLSTADTIAESTHQDMMTQSDQPRQTTDPEGFSGVEDTQTGSSHQDLESRNPTAGWSTNCPGGLAVGSFGGQRGDTTEWNLESSRFFESQPNEPRSTRNPPRYADLFRAQQELTEAEMYGDPDPTVCLPPRDENRFWDKTRKITKECYHGVRDGCARCKDIVTRRKSIRLPFRTRNRRGVTDSEGHSEKAPEGRGSEEHDGPQGNNDSSRNVASRIGPSHINRPSPSGNAAPDENTRPEKFPRGPVGEGTSFLGYRTPPREYHQYLAESSGSASAVATRHGSISDGTLIGSSPLVDSSPSVGSSPPTGPSTPSRRHIPLSPIVDRKIIRECQSQIHSLTTKNEQRPDPGGA